MGLTYLQPKQDTRTLRTVQDWTEFLSKLPTQAQVWFENQYGNPYQLIDVETTVEQNTVTIK